MGKKFPVVNGHCYHSRGLYTSLQLLPYIATCRLTTTQTNYFLWSYQLPAPPPTCMQGPTMHWRAYIPSNSLRSNDRKYTRTYCNNGWNVGGLVVVGGRSLVLRALTAQTSDLGSIPRLCIVFKKSILLVWLLLSVHTDHWFPSLQPQFVLMFFAGGDSGRANKMHGSAERSYHKPNDVPVVEEVSMCV